MGIKRYSSLIVGFLFLSLAVALWAMPAQETSDPPASSDITIVLLDRVQVVNTQRTARFSGVTRAKNRAVLSFSIPARVVERRVDAGSRVRKGDILARLDDREYRHAVQLALASVAELTAQREQAGRDRRRFQTLAAADVVTISDLEKVTTREAALAAALNAADARLADARRLLGETVLKAPFGGTITGPQIQPGEWAVPGQPAIELTGDGAIELLVEVPESIVYHLAVDQDVQVQLPFAEDRLIGGRIASVAKVALTGGRLFPVKVDLTYDPTVTAGMTAQLRVNLVTQGALTVPLASVVNPGASQPYVFIYDRGHVVKKPIKVGGIIDDRIIVNGDIGRGEQVVTSGQSHLADGDPVEAAL